MTDQKAYNQQLIKEFREARDIGDVPLNGRPIVLLTTRGAKSLQPRTTPMMYIPDGERILVVASNAGAAAHPDWYHNLLAHPDVIVEVGLETYDAAAVITTGPERQKLWSNITAQYPFFAEHQAQVKRQIPVIALERREVGATA